MTRPAYRIVDVNETNLDKYDLFCQKSKKRGEGYKNKLKWIKDRFREGLRLEILLVNEGPKRGFTSRGFIEYIPGKYTWRGIDAKGYMVIHCIWVVGRNKKKGYGSKLLKKCMKDAKGMKGVAVVTSKKGHWLPKEKLFVKHGFEKVDTASPDFELHAKRFSRGASPPKFNHASPKEMKKYAPGITILNSDQCPYTANTTKSILERARKLDLTVRVKRINTCEDAQKGVHPYGTFCVLKDGRVLTYHYFTQEHFEDLFGSRAITKTRR